MRDSRSFTFSFSLSSSARVSATISSSSAFFTSRELDFLAQRVVLTVVLHIVQLVLITGHAGLSLNDLTLLLGDSALEVGNLCLDLLYTGSQTFNLVFQVLNLEGQLASQCTLLVDRREGGLKLIQGLQLLFHSQVCWIFLCHNSFFR